MWPIGQIWPPGVKDLLICSCLLKKLSEYKWEIPVSAREGRDYFAAMACAANYAWVNRQVKSHRVREG
ncbi:MAG TPA: hypothetical protein ENH12_02395 [Proteobacteria bacterium]|nr:hypothetical protein [Pseudomonadota bacterium]